MHVSAAHLHAPVLRNDGPHGKPGGGGISSAVLFEYAPDYREADTLPARDDHILNGYRIGQPGPADTVLRAYKCMRVTSGVSALPLSSA